MLLNNSTVKAEIIWVLTLFQTGLFRAAPQHLSYISYIDETWHSYTLPKEYPRKINQVTHTLSSVDITTFVISRNTDIDCILIHDF